MGVPILDKSLPWDRRAGSRLAEACGACGACGHRREAMIPTEPRLASVWEFAPGVWGDARRAVWLEAERALLVADLHLGHLWVERRRGALPPIVPDDTLERLAGLLREYRPGRCFLSTPRRVVLPALSRWAAGVPWDARPALSPLAAEDPPQLALAILGERLVPVPLGR